MAKEKAQIRKEVIARRDSISEELRKSKDIRIRERLTGLPEFISARAILLYASFRSEADTFELIKLCFSTGKTVMLPKVDKAVGMLLLYEIRDLKELADGNFGVPEPAVSEERLRTIDGVDVVIVPGVAFDEKCNRLGYGKGFYDKLLGKKGIRGSGFPNPCIIGLAFEEQIVDSLPSEPHDMKMDKIITDKRIIDCGP